MGKDMGATGLLVVASVFPANMAFAKVPYFICVMGLPRSQAWLPTARRPWSWAALAQGPEISGRAGALPRSVLSSPQPGQAKA
jgi:hypothetical protein